MAGAGGVLGGSRSAWGCSTRCRRHAGGSRRRPHMTMLDELLRTRVARFVDRLPDWDAFADARVEGYRRAPPPHIAPRGPRKRAARAVPPPAFPPSAPFRSP